MQDTPARITATRLLVTTIGVVVFPGLIIFLSGDWLWPAGWAFAVWFLAQFLVIVAYLYRHDRALLAERYSKFNVGSQERWDRYLSAGLGTGFVLWLVIIPVDARFGWTPDLPLAARILGGTGLLPSSFLTYGAYRDNTFLSPWVRIQAERNHHVISTGVYSFVRHPMYLGAILMFISAPAMMGSLYGMLTGVLLSLLIAGRSVGEEKMLAGKLEGYAEYMKKVKYRLIPFVW